MMHIVMFCINDFHHKIVSSIPVFRSYVGFQFTSVFKRSTLTPTNKGSSLEKGLHLV